MWLRLLLCFGVLLATVESQKPLYSSFFGVPGTNATFEYVIVGGGTAGLALATRLAAKYTVAVVEAGGFYETDNGNLSVVPGYSTYFTGSDAENFQPLVDWGISTVKQQPPINRRLHYARGKTLGGSSARNFFLYQRPTAGSMQKWAEAVGDESYTWENMLPFFQKSVNYTGPANASYTNSSNPQDPSAFSAAGGPLQVSFSNAVDPLGTWVRPAFIAAGLPQIPGFSSGSLLGSGYAGLTIDPANGHRSSSESSFLRWALQDGRAPRVYKNTLATRILFEDATSTSSGNSTTARRPRASGITALTAGTFGTGSVSFTLTATREVILSAGAFQSPQLLMVSGVGNCTELAALDIPCVRNLTGVGSNMWDHPIFGSSHRVSVNTASASANNATLAATLAALYDATGSGPLSISGPGYYGWEKLPEPYRSLLDPGSRAALEDDSFADDWPEIEWLPVGSYSGDNGNRQTADPRDGHNYATLSACLVAPLSRGTVRLASADMTTLPLVDPAWLTHPADLDLAVQAFKRQRALWEVLVGLGVADAEEAYPGSSVQTDEEIRAWIGEIVTTVFHASATNKMGIEADESAVVDSNGLVFGVGSLRVVDASAMPFLTPGHPQSIVYALAEKVAGILLQETN